MPMISRGTGAFRKRRILISGLPNRGKTQSMYTFHEPGESMVILCCPGETGVHSLQEDTADIQSYYFENVSEKDRKTVVWCRDALSDFDKVYKEVEQNKPDKLFIDGVHNLYELAFNIITDGMFLAGQDLRLTDGKGYNAAGMYSRGHTTFGGRLKMYYDSPIPFVGVTAWERLVGAKTGDEGGAGNKIDIKDDRYWWPYLPGDMATKVVGFFDANISARLEKSCIHPNCEYSKKKQLHHVWQIYPYDDVVAVGIKGLTIKEEWKTKPYVHQSWTALKQLLQRAR